MNCEHDSGRQIFVDITHTMHHHYETGYCIDCDSNYKKQELINNCDCDVDMSPNHPNTDGRAPAK
jgi:hypothetical protein